VRRAVAIAAVLPAILIALHGLAILPLSWTEQPLTALSPGAGRQFVQPLGTSWMSRYQVGESPAIVLEDGVALACANTPPETIAEFGAGGYMLADGNVYLSAADNSDPRSNGRRYVLRWPAPVNSAVIAVAALIALAGMFVLAWDCRDRLRVLLAAPPLALSVAIFVAPFVLHRAWPLIDVPLPGVHVDTETYYVPVQELLAGRWPHFEVRPPVYPAFLAATLLVTKRLVAVIWLQSLLTAAAALVMIAGAHRLARAASPWVAIAMAAWATSFWSLEFDTSILSDSLYASAIVFAFGFLLWGLAAGSRALLAASSVAIAAAIATRPAGLFLAVTFAIAAIYLWHTGRSWRLIAAFALPFPALMLALSLYNFSIAGVFAVTAWGEANLAVATFTFWEEDPAYPPAVNERVAMTVASLGVTDDERRRREDTWSPSVLWPIFLKGVNLKALDIASEVGGGYGGARTWLRRISIDAIRKHPRIYSKFVASMAYMFFVENIRWRADFVNYLNGRSLRLLTSDGQAELRRKPITGDMLDRYFAPSPSLRLMARDACARGGAPMIEATSARRVYRVLQRARDLVFARPVFVLLAGASLLAGAWRLARTRGRHDVAFAVFLLGISVVGSGMLVSLVEYAGHRYSYPTEFAVFSVIALSPWLGRARA
jgi:hypothetical protein